MGLRIKSARTQAHIAHSKVERSLRSRMRPAGAMSPQPRAEWSATKRHPGTNGTTSRVADAIIDHTPYRGKSPINRRRPTLLLLQSGS